MAALRTTLCAVVMVTVVLCRPVSLSDGEESKSSESIESTSSEETAPDVEPSQEPSQGPSQGPALMGTDMPNAIEVTDPPATASMLPSSDAGPSLVAIDPSALPDPEDPQTSTDAGPPPDDTSQTVLGVDISQDMPESDTEQHPVNLDSVHLLPEAEVSLDLGVTQPDVSLATDGTNQPQDTTTYRGLPWGATPPFPPHILQSTAEPYSKATPLQIPVGNPLTSVPVCFTFQFTTSEPKQPRGDSI